MKKREFDELKTRNTKILNDIITIEMNEENLTDQMEILTEKEFSNYVSTVDKIASKGRKSYKTKNSLSKEQIEEAKRDVPSELEKAINIFNNLNDIARENNLIIENEQDNFIINTEKKVDELYKQSIETILTPEQISDLLNYTRQMNYNELVRNYVDMGRVVTKDKIEKLQKATENKVLMVFKPTILKFKEKLGLIKDDIFENPQEHVEEIKKETKDYSERIKEAINKNYDLFYDSLLNDNFDEISYEEIGNELEKIIDLANKTKELRMQYEKTNVPSENGFYPVDTIIKREEAWNEYISNLYKTIKLSQTIRLKIIFSDIQKYKVSDTSNGNMICLKVGNEFLPVSKDKDHFLNDIEQFRQKITEYNKSLSISENSFDKEEETTKEERPSLEELPSIEINEENPKEEKPSLEELPAIEIKEEPVVMPLTEEELERITPTKEEKPSLEELPAIEIKEEPVVMPLTEEELEKITSIKEEPPKEEKTSIEELPAIEIKEEPVVMPLTEEELEKITAIKEENSKEEKPSSEELPAIEIKEEPVVMPLTEEELEKITTVKEETKEEENRKMLEQLPTIEAKEEPEEKSSIEAKAALSKQAYIEFMSCFVDRDEAEKLATPHNLEIFESSNLGYSKYIENIDTGKIDRNTTYGNFVVSQLQKDNGIKYEKDDEIEPIQKDDSGIDIIVSDENPTIISNIEPDLSGFDVFTDDPTQFTDEVAQFSAKTK